MRVLRCSATSPGARQRLQPVRKAVKGIQSRPSVVSVSASLESHPSYGDEDVPSSPTLHGKLNYIAVLAAVFTIAPACIPLLASGGGGGNGFLPGFGGGGGGGFFNSVVPKSACIYKTTDSQEGAMLDRRVNRLQPMKMTTTMMIPTKVTTMMMTAMRTMMMTMRMRRTTRRKRAW